MLARVEVECLDCGTKTVTGNTLDVLAAVQCPPGAGCCGKRHSHMQAANSCKRVHDGDCSVADPACAVCKAVTVRILAGTVRVTP